MQFEIIASVNGDEEVFGLSPVEVGLCLAGDQNGAGSLPAFLRRLCSSSLSVLISGPANVLGDVRQGSKLQFYR